MAQLQQTRSDRMDQFVFPQRGGPAIDQWIARELKRSYDRTLSERVPAELATLLDRFPAHS